MIQPGMPGALGIAPAGPISLLNLPELPDAGPETEVVIGGIPPADAPEFDIDVPPPAILDLP